MFGWRRRFDHKLDVITKMLMASANREVRMASQFDELKALVAEQGAVIAEVASDVDAMLAEIALLDDPAEIAEVVARVKESNDRLKAVAAKYPVPTPPPAA